MRLTSSVKELEAILQKLIKIDHSINLEQIPIEKMRQITMVGVDGDADALGPAVFGVGLGATTETKCSHKNWK